MACALFVQLFYSPKAAFQIVDEGIIGAVEEVGVEVPVVVRLEGTNVEKGAEILRQSDLNIIAGSSLADAAQKVVKAAGGAV